MKLPIDFGTKIFFRVVFPGLVLAALLSRPSYGVLQALGYGEHWAILFAAEVLVFGSFFVALDMPIYMLFEGRRFWPAWAHESLLGMERARLLRLLLVATGKERRKQGTFRRSLDRRNHTNRRVEAQVEVSHFPLSKAMLPDVAYPTRLGNLITAFEQYSLVKYGLDSIFFWPRIWVSIDQSLREEIDNHQALADGLLYSVCAFIIGGLGLLLVAPVDYFAPSFMPFSVIWPVNILAAFVCFAAAAIVYRLSLYVHAQFGELFKATIDQHRDKLRIKEVVELVSRMTGDPLLLRQSERTKNIAAFRYLKWQKYRVTGAKRNRTLRP